MDSDFDFINDRYQKRNDSIYCWLLCADKLHIIKDIRILIAKIVIEITKPLYEREDEIVTKSGIKFTLSQRTVFFDSYGFQFVWTGSKNGYDQYAPCKICYVPTIMTMVYTEDGIIALNKIKTKCFRHGYLTHDKIKDEPTHPEEIVYINGHF